MKKIQLVVLDNFTFSTRFAKVKKRGVGQVAQYALMSVACLMAWANGYRKNSHNSTSPTLLFKDAFELKSLLDDLGSLPPNAALFTSDATSMQINIHTEPVLCEIASYL
jgi:hypothetical protein